MTSKTVQEMLVEGRLERGSRNPTQAGGDPSGSYALLYDAARKAVAAHMLSTAFGSRSAPERTPLSSPTPRPNSPPSAATTSTTSTACAEPATTPDTSRRRAVGRASPIR